MCGLHILVLWSTTHKSQANDVDPIVCVLAILLHILKKDLFTYAFALENQTPIQEYDE